MVARGSSAWDGGAGIASPAPALRARLTGLGEEDAGALAHGLVTMRDQTGRPEQRDYALGLALLRAAEVPLRIAEAAADVAELAAAAAGGGAPPLTARATARGGAPPQARRDCRCGARRSGNAGGNPSRRDQSRDRPGRPAFGAGRAARVRSGGSEGARAGSDMSERAMPAWSLTAEAAGSIGIPAEWPDRVTRDWAIGG